MVQGCVPTAQAHDEGPRPEPPAPVHEGGALFRVTPHPPSCLVVSWHRARCFREGRPRWVLLSFPSPMAQTQSCGGGFIPRGKGTPLRCSGARRKWGLAGCSERAGSPPPFPRPASGRDSVPLRQRGCVHTDGWRRRLELSRPGAGPRGCRHCTRPESPPAGSFCPGGVPGPGGKVPPPTTALSRGPGSSLPRCSVVAATVSTAHGGMCQGAPDSRTGPAVGQHASVTESQRCRHPHHPCNARSPLTEAPVAARGPRPALPPRGWSARRPPARRSPRLGPCSRETPSRPRVWSLLSDQGPLLCVMEMSADRGEP